jgi:4-amino-4-deoxy-L-arabinose transferase-like glycosyltransferase
MTPARRSRKVWLLALAFVLALAWILRLPQLQLVPHLTDETGEVLFAHAIAFTGARPLTHTDAYNGPLWAYLLAGALKLAGSSAMLPRQFALLLGLGTVAATFGLGAALARADRRPYAALVAGALMATSFTHVLVGSRVAWSNSSTPLWTTLTVLVLLAAVRKWEAASVDSGSLTSDARAGGPRLLLAGFLGGLALHTHPSVIVFLAGLALWFLLDRGRRAWLRTPWPWLAVLAALIAYSPVIVFNLRDGFQSVREAQASVNAADGPALAGWIGGLAGALAQLGRSMVGGFTLDGIARDPLSILMASFYAAAMLGAAVLVARDRDLPVGRRLPLVVVGVALLGLPLFNRNWQGFLEARYLAYTLPLLYATAGAIAAEWPPWEQRGWRRSAVRIGLIAFVLLPALRVLQYERSALAEALDNRRLWAMVAAADAGVAAGASVFVDNDLRDVAWRPGGHPRRAIEYLLTMEGIPFTRAPLEKIHHFVAADDKPLVLFLAGATADALGTEGSLTPANVTPRPGEGAWGMYVRR